MQLSKRLETIFHMIRPCRCLADIGTDHAYLPIACVQENKAETAVASDVRQGPLERAEAHVREAGLSGKISLRLGDGLSTLRPGEADEIVIAGMGGKLMKRLLLDGEAQVKAAELLVLSPHTDIPEVREALHPLGFSITDEAMVSEEGKFYTVILAERKEASPLTEEELLYGLVLLKKRPEAFLQWLSFKEKTLEERLEAFSLQEKEGKLSGRGLQAKRAAENELEAVRKLQGDI